MYFNLEAQLCIVYELMSVESMERVTVVRLLLSHKANVNAVDYRKRTPLHLAVNACPATADASCEIVSLLIEHGADLFAKDCRGRIPLHYAFVKIGK